MRNRFTLLPRDFSNTPDRELGAFGTAQKRLIIKNISTPKCAIIPLKTLKNIAAANSIPEKISKVLLHTNFNDPVACTKLKKTITECITQAKIPREILQELGELYHEYLAGGSVKIFAANTHLNHNNQSVLGDANVFKTLLQVWAESTITTLFRSNSRHIHPSLLAQNLVILEITKPIAQGFIYTRHPHTGIKTSIYITVANQPATIPSTVTTSTAYEVDIRTWNIIARPHAVNATTPLLENNRVIQLAKIGNTIKKQYLEHKCIKWELVRNTIIVTGYDNFYLDTRSQAQKTMTAVYISAGNPQLAREYSELPISGIGYLKSEYSLLSLGSHPLSIIRSGRKSLIENAIIRTLSTFAQIPTISHIVYKAFDVPSSELQKLHHATPYELDEENSWLGVRGAGKALLQPALLEAEIAAVTAFSKESTTRISLLLPFVRSASELHRLVRLVQATHMDHTRVEPWMHIMTPEPLLDIASYPLEHISGISIQLDSIVQLLLGISPTHTYRDDYTLSTKVLETILQPFFKTLKSHVHLDIPVHIQMEQYNHAYAGLAVKLGVHALTVRPRVAPLAKACIIDTETAPFRASSLSNKKITHI